MPGGAGEGIPAGRPREDLLGEKAQKREGTWCVWEAELLGHTWSMWG